MLLSHTEACQAASLQLPGFGEAALLLRTWLRRQLPGDAADGMSPFLLTMLLLHQLEQGKLVRWWGCRPGGGRLVARQGAHSHTHTRSGKDDSCFADTP